MESSLCITRPFDRRRRFMAAAQQTTEKITQALAKEA